MVPAVTGPPIPCVADDHEGRLPVREIDASLLEVPVNVPGCDQAARGSAGLAGAGHGGHVRREAPAAGYREAEVPEPRSDRPAGTPRRVRDAPGRDPLVAEPLDGIERSRNGLVPDRKNTVDIDQYGFDAHDSSFSAVPGSAPGPPAAVGARRDRRMHPRTVPVASSPPSRPAPTVISTLTGHPVDEAGISGDDGSARVGWGGRPATGHLQMMDGADCLFNGSGPCRTDGRGDRPGHPGTPRRSPDAGREPFPPRPGARIAIRTALRINDNVNNGMDGN